MYFYQENHMLDFSFKCFWVIPYGGHYLSKGFILTKTPDLIFKGDSR